MRKAGALAAEALDLLVARVQPGRHHRRARQVRLRIRARPRRLSRAAQLPRLPQVDLHLDQPRRLPRHSRRQAAARRRHRQHRRDRDRRRLARRHQPHVCRRRAAAARAAADRRHLRGLLRGIAAVKPGATTGDIGHAIQSYVEAERCSVVRDFCGHGARPAVPRRAEHPAFRPPRRGRAAAARHVLHHRADDQSRRPRR